MKPGESTEAQPAEALRLEPPAPVEAPASVTLGEGSIFAGDYRIERPLRAGGMGAVYVVTQLSTEKQRALKVMQPSIVTDPEFRRRFELEARIGSRIKSDHVVEVITSGFDAATRLPFLVMELLEGEDLSGALTRRGTFPPGEVREVFDQLCHALGEAHSQNVVHRDLKPENVFLATARRRGVPFTVKVLDFGIARVVAEAQAAAPTTTQSLGTPLWMAPEQMETGGVIVPATDVWALGLIAFRMLVGRVFWKSAYEERRSIASLTTEMTATTHPGAHERAAEYGLEVRVPAGFDAWFSSCVAHASSDRFSNAAEAFQALDPILKAVEGPARLAATQVSATAPSSNEGVPPTAPDSVPFAAATVSSAVYDVPTTAPSPGVKPHRKDGSRRVLGFVGGGVVLLAAIASGLWYADSEGVWPFAVAAHEPAPHHAAPVAPDCQEYLREIECSLQKLEPPARETALRSAREKVREAGAASVAFCKQQLAAQKATLRAAGCAK